VKPFAALIDVRCLGFYGIIKHGGEADTHPLHAVCAASPALCGSSNPGLQPASSPGCHHSDTSPTTRVPGTEGRAPRRGGEDLLLFPAQQPLVNGHHQLPTKNVLPSCSSSLASSSTAGSVQGGSTLGGLGPSPCRRQPCPWQCGWPAASRSPLPRSDLGAEPTGGQICSPLVPRVGRIGLQRLVRLRRRLKQRSEERSC